LTRGEKYVEAKICKLERDFASCKDAAEHVEAEIEVAPKLGLIDIQDQPIKDLGAKMIAEYLEKDNCKVEKLHLKRNSMTPEGCARLAASLRKNKTLKEMSIVENKMVDFQEMAEQGSGDVIEDTVSATSTAKASERNSATSLVDSLKVNVAMQKLHLEGNNLGDSGCAVFCECLKENTTLCDIAMRRNEIGEEGAKALTKMLETNSSVTRLDLQENQLGDNGVAVLCVGLEKNVGLQEVNLRATGLTTAVCKHLVAMLQTNTKLLELNMQRNSLKDEGCSILSQA
jgi:Ran GTPase-activating protein (RanGAP) involved in mRNA processing and transport